MPDGNAAAQRVLGVAKALRECEYNVRFSGLSRTSRTPECRLAEDFTYINYPYPATLPAWLKYLSGRDSSIAEIKSFKPDLVILYNHPAFAIEHIAKFCHRNGIKVLADVTEWYEPQGNPVFKAIKGYDTTRRMRKSHSMTDGLICISSYLADFYRERGANVVELPPLVDTAQSKWHQHTESHPGELRFVYAGSPGSAKDRLDLILEAFDEIVPNIERIIRFDIIGITNEQYTATWSDSKHRDYVVFNGRCSHEEVIKKLLNADFQIFLRPDTLPNRAGFPTKFVETISSRTLPITNLSSNLSDYLIDGENGFVITGFDKQSIKKAVTKAFEHTIEEINNMKMRLDKDTFDYRQYTNRLTRFLDTL